jgi:hypothetical protein
MTITITAFEQSPDGGKIRAFAGRSKKRACLTRSAVFRSVR